MPALRVVQWATGNIGRRALKEVIKDPRLELVGVLVYDPAKDGVDAGSLCGEPPVGVAATTDPEKVHALGADCVIYMPSHPELDHVVRLLAAGTNVVTTCGVFFDEGRPLGAEGREPVLAACGQGGTSVFATGASPGFITDALPYALLSLQRRLESLQIEEFADMSRRDSPDMIFNRMGFGLSPDHAAADRSAHLLASFGPPLDALARSAGRPVRSWGSRTELAVAQKTVQLVAGELRAGTVGGQRTVISGNDGDGEVVRFTATWFCTTDLDPAWELLPTGWQVKVRGDAPMDVSLPLAVAFEDFTAVMPAFTAIRPVNAVPFVVAARPGILSARDLPPITPAGPEPQPPLYQPPL